MIVEYVKTNDIKLQGITVLPRKFLQFFRMNLNLRPLAPNHYLLT